MWAGLSTAQHQLVNFTPMGNVFVKLRTSISGLLSIRISALCCCINYTFLPNYIIFNLNAIADTLEKKIGVQKKQRPVPDFNVRVAGHIISCYQNTTVQIRSARLDLDNSQPQIPTARCVSFSSTNTGELSIKTCINKITRTNSPAVYF